MKNQRIGFLRHAGLFGLILTSLAILLSLLLSGFSIFSPGNLSLESSGEQLGGVESHFDLSSSCSSCHPPPWSKTVQNDLCLECHQGVEIQLTDEHSLHGSMWFVNLINNCRDCHPEHLGLNSYLTNYEGEGFPHHLVGISLNSHSDPGLDQEIICRDCHPVSFSAFTQDTCTDCHVEIDATFVTNHLSGFGGKCLACHDGQETINSTYAHDQGDFNLTGAHSTIACDSCHHGSGSIKEFQQTPSDCLSCHWQEDIHQPPLSFTCEKCHTPSTWAAIHFDHSLTGFELIGGHSELACDACHANLLFEGNSTDCYSCHEQDEPHQLLFGTGCEQCHVPDSWDRIVFDHNGPYADLCSTCHDADKPEMHFSGQCSTCHQTSAWLPASFDHQDANATDCLSCHIGDAPANHFGGQCSFCHDTTSWLPAFFNHTFPLTHGGTQSTCSTCHPSNYYPAYTCYGCHEHNQTEIRNEHEGISNLENCIRCHPDGQKHEDGGSDD